jgi:hypothetical protein
MAQFAAQSGDGNKARLLRGVLRQLDQSLENASEGFPQANRNFAQASRDIEAIQVGHQAATHGRSEDVIPAYQALRPEAQAAFRSGYVDPLIAQTEGATFGVNKARPFTNDAFGAEASAMSWCSAGLVAKRPCSKPATMRSAVRALQTILPMAMRWASKVARVDNLCRNIARGRNSPNPESFCDVAEESRKPDR